MEERNYNPTYNSHMNGAYTYGHSFTHAKTNAETSTPASAMKKTQTDTNPDIMNSLLGMINTHINSSIGEIKKAIEQVKIDSDANTKSISDKIDGIPKYHWVESLLNPATLAVIGVFVILLLILLSVLLKKFTSVSFSDVKDYLFFLSGGLVGLLSKGSEKTKPEEKNK